MRARRWSWRWSSHTIALLAAFVTLVPGMPALSQPAPSYVLGPGDVLEIAVWGYADLTRVIIVPPDGKIALPLVGTVTATGASVERLTVLLSQGFALYIIKPQVTVTVKEFRKIRVSVLGQVRQPGTYTLAPDARVLDAISAAGGFTDVAASDQAQLLRPGGPSAVVDLQRLLAGDPMVNVPLRGGETLVIPEDLVNMVSVLGEVARPGRYRLKGEMHVLDVLLSAGGLTERASVTQARLVRASRESQPLHLDNLLLGRDMKHNIALKPGDALFIPEETNNKIYVLGDVRNPGVYQLKGEVTLLQALAIAGGPVQRGIGTSQSAYVVRRNGRERLMTSAWDVKELANNGALYTMDLREVIDKGNVQQNVVMQPGDVVVVNESGESALQAIVNILSGIAGIIWRR